MLITSLKNVLLNTERFFIVVSTINSGKAAAISLRKYSKCAVKTQWPSEIKFRGITFEALTDRISTAMNRAGGKFILPSGL